MDFTFDTYRKLLISLKDHGYYFQTFEEFITRPSGKSVILRHDIDRKPYNALRIAEIEASLGVRASYHLRIRTVIRTPDIINYLTKTGHELAYHYEDLTSVAVSGKYTQSEIEEAFNSFRKNLALLRQFYNVKVISMHGVPYSSVSNRDLWKYYNYKKEGIICESYLDIDYSKVLYLTDTGRTWENVKSNLYDVVKKGEGLTQNEPIYSNYKIKSTGELICAIEESRLPENIIINTHPQRWTDNTLNWLLELLSQNLRNFVKTIIYFTRR